MSTQFVKSNYFSVSLKAINSFSAVDDSGSILTKSIFSEEPQSNTKSNVNTLIFSLPNHLTEKVFEETDRGVNTVYFKDLKSFFDDLNS
jgi:hypothetical protein